MAYVICMEHDCRYCKGGTCDTKTKEENNGVCNKPIDLDSAFYIIEEEETK